MNYVLLLFFVGYMSRPVPTPPIYFADHQRCEDALRDVKADFIAEDIWSAHCEPVGAGSLSMAGGYPAAATPPANPQDLPFPLQPLPHKQP